MYFTWLTAPRMSVQLNAGAISDTTRTLKTIHTIHSLIHPNKADMIRIIMMTKWYSGNRGGPKLSWHLFYWWGKTTKKPHLENMFLPGIEPGPAVWQARILPPAPQRWIINRSIWLKFCILFLWFRTEFLKHFWSGDHFFKSEQFRGHIIFPFESKFISFVTHFNKGILTVYAIWQVLLLVYDVGLQNATISLCRVKIVINT